MPPWTSSHRKSHDRALDRCTNLQIGARSATRETPSKGAQNRRSRVVRKLAGDKQHEAHNVSESSRLDSATSCASVRTICVVFTGTCPSRRPRKTMLLGMSRGHFRAFWLGRRRGCGKTGTGHKGKLLVSQQNPVDEIVGEGCWRRAGKLAGWQLSRLAVLQERPYTRDRPAGDPALPGRSPVQRSRLRSRQLAGLTSS